MNIQNGTENGTMAMLQACYAASNSATGEISVPAGFENQKHGNRGVLVWTGGDCLSENGKDYVGEWATIGAQQVAGFTRRIINGLLAREWTLPSGDGSGNLDPSGNSWSKRQQAEAISTLFNGADDIGAAFATLGELAQVAAFETSGPSDSGPGVSVGGVSVDTGNGGGVSIGESNGDAVTITVGDAAPAPAAPAANEANAFDLTAAAVQAIRDNGKGHTLCYRNSKGEVQTIDATLAPARVASKALNALKMIGANVAGYRTYRVSEVAAYKKAIHADTALLMDTIGAMTAPLPVNGVPANVPSVWPADIVSRYAAHAVAAGLPERKVTQQAAAKVAPEQGQNIATSLWG